jgi:hypothetical protein
MKRFALEKVLREKRIMGCARRTRAPKKGPKRRRFGARRACSPGPLSNENLFVTTGDVDFGHPKKHSEHSNKFKGMPNMASHWPLQQESHSDEPGRCQA